MTTALILGSGMVATPLVDYLIDTCRYRVVLTDFSAEGAARIIRGRPLGVPTAWTARDTALLQRLVRDADVVVSMLPPALHPQVAQTCLAHRRHLVTTSYISDAMAALDGEARARNLIFLNEVGESPGLDHMSALALLDDARREGEEILELRSYAGGLPAFRWNTNPWGYKFSWSPRGVFKAVQAPAVYLERGRRIIVASQELFTHPRLADIQKVGVFETYPNRDATRYLEPYGLEPHVSLYRGLLRHRGWCAMMRAIGALGLLDDSEIHRFDRMTHASFLSTLLGCDEGDLQSALARRLGIGPYDPIIERLEWLGLCGSTSPRRAEGTALDIFLDLAVAKLAYGPGEQDMVVVHNEVVSRSEDKTTRRHTATLMAEGVPNGDSAMARAVGLTAGIATKLVVEGAVKARGVLGPFSSELYGPVLDEMATRGFRFAVHRSSLP
ncbi:saccharopine dehydrogenase NADP-binding domain-containing protein [Candidatus Fermentibacteria bacterium]|nr:saccharopine dehydrogenase NADP-binding domain-containing protein [Candidatus Fermentibacteria bacterium]